jgi:tRNA threonylcarbamoyladenosine biosynthesis protein TsaE
MGASRVKHIITNSSDETEALASRIAGVLQAGDALALRGPLGAGKTCFVRGLVAGVGLDRSLVSSPTFVIAQEYLDGMAICPIVHIDAYRIHHVDELRSAGLEELWARDVITVIEWPEQIEDALPPDRLDISISHLDESRRELTLEPRGAGTMAERIATVPGTG